MLGPGPMIYDQCWADESHMLDVTSCTDTCNNSTFSYLSHYDSVICLSNESADWSNTIIIIGNVLL